MKWIPIACIVLCTLVIPVSADIIDPNRGSSGGNGTAGAVITHCYIIENENQYPGYVFGFDALPHPGGGFLAIETYPCYGSLYHLAMPHVSVINRTLYSTLASRTTGYIRDPSIIYSDYWAPKVVYANKADNITSLTDVLTVTSLNSTCLVVKKSRAYYTYSDGHTEDLPDETRPPIPGTPIPRNTLSPRETDTPRLTGVPDENTDPSPPLSAPGTGSPGSSDPRTPVGSFQYIIIPLTAGGVIIALLIRRR
jgi:hypothetical protein